MPATNAAGEIIPKAKAPPEEEPVRPMSSPLILSLPKFHLPWARPWSEYSLAELIDIAQSNNPLTRTAWNNARNIALAAGIAKSR